jgi:hypothetical protein
MGKRGCKLGDTGMGLCVKEDTSYVILRWAYREKRIQAR